MIEKESALIVIDIQKEFGDKLPEGFRREVFVKNSLNVIEKFRKENKPLIFFREIHRKQKVDYGRELDGDEEIHCLEGTKEADYIDEIKPLDNEYQMIKRRYSCFFATDLDILLKGLGIKTLYIIGMLSDVCVHYTCADAHQHDYHLKVIEDAIAGSSLKAHKSSMKAIEYLQHGSVISAEEV